MPLIRREYRSDKSRRIVLRFLVPYAILLFIPLALGLVTYTKSIGLIGKQIGATNTAMMTQSKTMLDFRLGEIEQIMREIAGNPKIVRLQSQKDLFTGQNVYDILDASRSLYHYNLANNLIAHYFVILKNGNAVLNDSQIYKLDEFYDTFLKFRSMDFDRWYDLVLNTYHSRAILPAETVYFQGKPLSVIPVVQSLGLPSRIQGAVLVLLDNGTVRGMLDGLNVSDQGWAYIADEQGRIISFAAADESLVRTVGIEPGSGEGAMEIRLDGRDMIAVYSGTGETALRHVAVQPASIVNRKLIAYRRWTQAVIVASLAIGAIAALWMAYRNSKPIRRLVRTVIDTLGLEPQQTKDAIGMIHDAWAKIVQSNARLHLSNEELAEQMARQAAFVKFAVYERLLKGRIHSLSELQTLTHYADLSLDGVHFNVAIVDPYAGGERTGVLNAAMLQDMDARAIAVREVVLRYANEGIRLHENEEDRIVLIYSGRSPDVRSCRSELHRLLEQIRDTLTREFRIGATIAVGAFCSQALDLARSYEQAKTAWNAHAWDEDSRIVWFESLPPQATNYDYPGDVETKLLHLAKAGDAAEVRKWLDELFRRNFEERQLPLHLLQLLLGHMYGTVLKLAEQIRIDADDLHERIRSFGSGLKSRQEARDHFLAIADIYGDICEAVVRKRKSNNEKLLVDCKRFIDAKFAHPDLSLTMLADRFMMSEAYLSQFFKEQTGINFSDYLESKRIDCACLLLRTSDKSVREIAAESGYYSPNSFFKAFKRVLGMSPTEYRKMNRQYEAGHDWQ